MPEPGGQGAADGDIYAIYLPDGRKYTRVRAALKKHRPHIIDKKTANREKYIPSSLSVYRDGYLDT